MQASPDVPTNTWLNPKPELNHMLMNTKSSSRNTSWTENGSASVPRAE
jgi:hypothetical protein